MKRLGKRTLMVGAAALAYSIGAHATENGLLDYPAGVGTVLNGILPPPGATQYYNYTVLYTANKFIGNDGQSAIPNFRASVLVEAARILHTWNFHLGPFTLTSGAVLPISHVYTRLAGSSAVHNGTNDLLLQLFNVGYSNPSKGFFAYVASDFSVPTGSYQVNRLANNGLNYYTWQPSINATWLPTPQWELSASALVEVNAPNRATRYHSGSLFDLDYVVGYSPVKKLQLGVQGYILQQFTGDTLNGQPVADGFRGRVLAIGPQVRYTLGPASAITIKWQHEFAVRNRSQGDLLWAEFSFPL